MKPALDDTRLADYDVMHVPKDLDKKWKYEDWRPLGAQPLLQNVPGCFHYLETTANRKSIYDL